MDHPPSMDSQLARRRCRFAVSFCAFVAGVTVIAACSSLRIADRTATSEAGTTPDPAADDAGVDAGPMVNLEPPDDDGLPNVTYRGVSVVSNRVYVVGDETILELDGNKWSVIPVGGVDLYGVWADATDAWAVGTVKNTNTGVFMHRTKSTWVQFATVPHGLRGIYGSGAFRMAVGNDGAAYYGTLPTPFANGSQAERAPGVPETLSSPILHGVAGNSPSNVVIAGDVGAFYRYRGPGQPWGTDFDRTDRTRAYRSVFALPGAEPDVILGANYYGLWRYRGPSDADGNGLPMNMLHEERDTVLASQQYVTGIWGTSVERFVAVGTGGRLMAFTEGKPTSVFSTRAGARDLLGVSGTSFDDVWVVGADGTILHGSVPMP